MFEYFINCLLIGIPATALTLLVVIAPLYLMLVISERAGNK